MRDDRERFIFVQALAKVVLDTKSDEDEIREKCHFLYDLAGEIGADFDLSAKFIRETMLSLREGIYTGDKEMVKDTLNGLNQDDYLALWRLIPSYERRLIKEMSRESD